jgi:uncharacterized membrane protein
MVETARTKLILIRVLTALSAFVSAYLLVTSLQGGHVAGCGPASHCHHVLASRWAYWLGVPVSAPALLLYTTMFLATFWQGPGTSPQTRQKARTLLSLAAGTTLLAAAWFIGLQIFVVRELCPYCLFAHLAASTAALLVLREGARPSPAIARGAALGAAVLIAGQWINRPATHEIHAGSGAATSAPTARTARQLEIFGGMFKINVDEVPLIGRRDAPAVMVSLLDYTCRHCRKMHEILLEVERIHAGRLAIVTLPMPLDAACNKVIPRTAPPHANACQYARLGLAVWRADPSKMDRFNDWIFEPAIPPALESAIGYAQDIVGEETLGSGMNDPWVERQLAQNIAIYEATYKRFGKGVMPQLIVGDNIVFGELENGMQDLQLLLRDILK